MNNRSKESFKGDRNRGLVVIASFNIVLDVIVVALSVLYFLEIGWWAVAFIIAALSSAYMSYMAIRKNEPAWLLLDLILPN